VRHIITISLLVVATTLEASGDTIIRIGLGPHTIPARLLLMLGGLSPFMVSPSYSLIGAPGSSGGMTPSPLPWSCRPGMPAGRTRCRITNRTVRSLTRCARLSNSISPNSRRSSRHGASAVIEQWGGPDGMGHDDARGASLASASERRERALVPG
jgi:hypothetical protein